MNVQKIAQGYLQNKHEIVPISRKHHYQLHQNSEEEDATAQCTDYGCPIMAFFKHIPNFWAIWEDRPNKLWGIWGIFDRIISTYFGTALWVPCLWFPSFSCFPQKTFLFRPNPWTISRSPCLTQMYPKYNIGRKEFGHQIWFPAASNIWTDPT